MTVPGVERETNTGTEDEETDCGGVDGYVSSRMNARMVVAVGQIYLYPVITGIGSSVTSTMRPGVIRSRSRTEPVVMAGSVQGVVSKAGS